MKDTNQCNIKVFYVFYKMYKQQTNALQLYYVFLFMIFSPTCFGHLQENVFDTRIELQLNVSQSLHNTKTI
jgi:hypothetical protein